MERLLKDLKQSCRMFLQHPAFTITAVAALALGISTNVAIFSVVNAVLLKPLNAPDPDRVVAFISTSPEGSTSLASEIKFNLWRKEAGLFEDVAGYYFGALNLTGVEQPQQVNGVFVTGDYFRLFGVSMARGRRFTSEEEQVNGPNAVVLSEAFWKRVFAGDPKIVGKTISLKGDSYTVVGIVAGAAQTDTSEPPDVWLPFPISPNSTFQAHYFQAAGRLRPGVTLSAANARLQLTTQEFRREFPNTISTSRGDVLSVQPLKDVLGKDSRRSLLILAGAVSLVLLIACANVAGLLLMRASGRTREIAIRLAVGGSRWSIIRQLLTESMLLSITGGLFGIVLGVSGMHALLALNAAKLPRIGANGANVAMDWRVLLFTLAISIVTGLVFGLIPALQASRTDLEAGLRESSGRTGTGFRQSKARSLLVVSEVGFAMLLLIGAGLLIRTLIALRSVYPGFDAHNVMTTRTSLDTRAAKKTAVDQIIQDGFRRLGDLPGVESAGYTWMLPLDGEFNRLPIIVAGRPLNGPSHGFSRWMIVSSSYFRTMKIPLVRGRLFTESDRLGSPGVAIVNQVMARQLWPDGDPLNAQVFIGKGLGPKFAEPARQVIGIVGDVHEDALSESPKPAIFVPGAQLAESRMEGRTVAWVVRTRAQSASLNAAVLKELSLATGEPVTPVRSMEQVLSKSTAREKFDMLLMSIFGASALMLAAVGIYGLMAYAIQQRTREMGVRMALGAESQGLRNMVVWQGMRLAFAGMIIGVASAYGLTRYLASFLFGVQVLDPVVFLLAPICLGVVALAAVALPAHRASQVDPIQALRYE